MDRSEWDYTVEGENIRVGIKSGGVMKFIFITGEVQDESGYLSLLASRIERAGQGRKAPRLSEISPPLHWMFPDWSTHAD